MTRPIHRHRLIGRGLLAAALLVGLFSSASAADPEPLPERTQTLVVYGEDPCPQPADEEEIVVCARKPENERYRVPKSLRNRDDPPTEVSWASRTEELEEASRPGRPGSCSVVGSFGQTGCTQQLIRQWYNDRRGRRSRR
jgi:hypothetical protein